MNKILSPLMGVITTCMTLFISDINAQTSTDAIMMKKLEFCAVAAYDAGTWDQYWEGEKLRTNETIATFKRSTIISGVAIGLHDKVNLILAVPYINTSSSDPNGGKFEGAKGFQDLNISLKVQLMQRKIGKGELSVLSTVGYSTPVSNYLPDYMPYSIGLGANEAGVRLITEYKLESGLFARGSLAYLWRGQCEAERDYYYNNGSYYTSWMDVPNALNANFAFGIWLLNNSLRVESSYTIHHSTSGDDIRPYNAPQPTNKIEFDQVGLTAQYYLKQVKGFGVLANYSFMVDGRNMGKFMNLGAGLTYQFKI